MPVIMLNIFFIALLYKETINLKKKKKKRMILLWLYLEEKKKKKEFDNLS